MGTGRLFSFAAEHLAFHKGKENPAVEHGNEEANRNVVWEKEGSLPRTTRDDMDPEQFRKAEMEGKIKRDAKGRFAKGYRSTVGEGYTRLNAGQTPLRHEGEGNAPAGKVGEPGERSGPSAGMLSKVAQAIKGKVKEVQAFKKKGTTSNLDALKQAIAKSPSGVVNLRYENESYLKIVGLLIGEDYEKNPAAFFQQLDRIYEESGIDTQGDYIGDFYEETFDAVLAWAEKNGTIQNATGEVENLDQLTADVKNLQEGEYIDYDDLTWLQKKELADILSMSYFDEQAQMVFWGRVVLCRRP